MFVIFSTAMKRKEDLGAKLSFSFLSLFCSFCLLSLTAFFQLETWARGRECEYLVRGWNALLLLKCSGKTWGEAWCWHSTKKPLSLVRAFGAFMLLSQHSNLVWNHEHPNLHFCFTSDLPVSSFCFRTRFQSQIHVWFSYAQLHCTRLSWEVRQLWACHPL